MGHENFSIPHNGNVSNSLMFAPNKSDGAPIDPAMGRAEQLNTVATEIIQTKGASETHPALSPNDEFAASRPATSTCSARAASSARSITATCARALIDGVGFQEMSSAPTRSSYGIVAGADSHNAFSDNEEFNYTGVHGNTDKTPKIRLSSGVTVAGEAPKDFGTPGATGVWAPENTREAIFDAIKSKETFGTSGPLIRLRFFGGWGYRPGSRQGQGLREEGLRRRRPDGRRPAQEARQAKAPTFAVWALKDPKSGNLDRVQIVKGWYKRATAGRRSTTWSGRMAASRTRRRASCRRSATR